MLNVRINEADAIILREHIRVAHKSLLDPVCDGPIDQLDDLPIDVLAAIHTANHMQPWKEHRVDDWLVKPREDVVECGLCVMPAKFEVVPDLDEDDGTFGACERHLDEIAGQYDRPTINPIQFWRP